MQIVQFHELLYICYLLPRAMDMAATTAALWLTGCSLAEANSIGLDPRIAIQLSDTRTNGAFRR